MSDGCKLALDMGYNSKGRFRLIGPDDDVFTESRKSALRLMEALSKPEGQLWRRPEKSEIKGDGK